MTEYIFEYTRAALHSHYYMYADVLVCCFKMSIKAISNERKKSKQKQLANVPIEIYNKYLITM